MQSITLGSTHLRETRTTVPLGCPTCHRLNIERDIVLRTVAHLLAAGYYLNIANGGDGEELAAPSRNVSDIVLALMETDDEFLTVYQNAADQRRFGWVRFVYGNDGWDVISDYTVNLEEALAPVNAYVTEVYE
jgi:hypothetical protein